VIDRLVSDPIGFLQHLVLMAPALLLAVTVHEVAHGWVADRLGDPTARMQGRLTLNPLPHLDPLGAIAFVIAGFGWAKPVPVNPRYFRHPMRAMACVGAAGPVSNFVVAFTGLAALALFEWVPAPSYVAVPVGRILLLVYQLNLLLGIFNLIPLPPLDGGHFLPYVLPRGSWTFQRQLQQYGPLLLLVLVISGATGYIVWPIFNVMNRLYVAGVGLLL
jgi:Zn-dependent protease